MDALLGLPLSLGFASARRLMATLNGNLGAAVGAFIAAPGVVVNGLPQWLRHARSVHECGCPRASAPVTMHPQVDRILVAPQDITSPATASLSLLSALPFRWVARPSRAVPSLVNYMTQQLAGQSHPRGSRS